MKTKKLHPEAEMASANDGQNIPEKTRYTRYYEHDGMLRAYANRSMVLAMVFGAIALSSLAFAVYVRLQPPTVIRVDSEGEATVVAGTAVPGHSRGLNFVASAAEAAPTEVEAKAVVRRFLDRYLNLTPATVDRQMADALNMMTGNFKALVLGRLREDDTINKIQDDHFSPASDSAALCCPASSGLSFSKPDHPPLPRSPSRSRCLRVPSRFPASPSTIRIRRPCCRPQTRISCAMTTSAKSLSRTTSRRPSTSVRSRPA